MKDFVHASSDVLCLLLRAAAGVALLLLAGGCDSGGADDAGTEEVVWVQPGAAVDGVVIDVDGETRGVAFAVQYVDDGGRVKTYHARDSLRVAVRAKHCSAFSVDWAVATTDSLAAAAIYFVAVAWWDRQLVYESPAQVPRYPSARGAFAVPPPPSHACDDPAP